jgi:hypothetical protein
MRATVPCFFVALCSLHPILLVERAFPFLQYFYGPRGLYELALKPGWLVLSLHELVAAEIRLYQQSDVVGLAPHLILVFLMAGE